MTKTIILLIAGFILSLSLQPSLGAQELWMSNYEDTYSKSAMDLDSSTRKAVSLSERYPDSALHLLDHLYEQSREFHYAYGAAGALLATGSIYLTQKGDSRKAFACFSKARNYGNYLTGARKEVFEIKWNNCMGAAFLSGDQYDSAMIHLITALNKVDQSSDRDNKKIAIDIAMLYNNISIVNTSLKQSEQSMIYIRKEAELIAREHLESRTITNYLSHVYNYLDRKKYDSASLYLKKASLRTDSFTPLEKIYFNMANGSFYFRQGLMNQAIPYLKEALLLSEKRKPDLYSISLSNLAAACFSMGDFKNAAYYSQAILDKKDILNTPDYVLGNLYNNLSILYDSLKDYKKAYYYRTLTSQIRESISNTEKTKNINELETRYRTAENEKALARKKLELISAENSINKKNLWIRGITSGTLVLALLATFFIQRQRLKLQKTKTQQQLQQNTQLKTIIESEEKERNRIGHQLHDDVMVEFSIVKMNMAALPELYPELRQIEGYRDLTRQLDLASTKLRQTAHNLMPGFLTEEGLLSAINYFCTAVQKTSGLKVNFQHYGNIPRLPADTEISLYRMVQELVQNVIKHAGATEILVRISYGDGDINIMVEDNGRGIQHMEKALDGMGLKSIALRLQAMQGEMEIATVSPQGTSVQIDLQVQAPG